MLRSDFPESDMVFSLQMTLVDVCGARPSLSDAKPGEDPPEQVVAGELAGDLVQRLLRDPQLLGHELPGAPLDEQPRGLLGVLARERERLEVALASADRATVDALITHAGLEVGAQLREPGARERRDHETRRPADFVRDR